MNRKLLLSIITIFLFLGCAQKPMLDMKNKPQYQVEKKITPPVSNKGSLFTRKGASLFADKKDLQIGDIIEIEIELTETIESGVSRDNDSSYDSTQAAGTFISNNGHTANTAKRLNSAIGLGFNTASDKAFDANANSSSKDKISNSQISAVVKNVYQNGNYFIEGSRETLILGQKLTVKLSGVIRPHDIDPTNNKIDSKKIANLKVLYEKDGEEVDIIKKKWGTRLIDAIWPF